MENVYIKTRPQSLNHKCLCITHLPGRPSSPGGPNTVRPEGPTSPIGPIGPGRPGGPCSPRVPLNPWLTKNILIQTKTII